MKRPTASLVPSLRRYRRHDASLVQARDAARSSCEAVEGGVQSEETEALPAKSPAMSE